MFLTFSACRRREIAIMALMRWRFVSQLFRVYYRLSGRETVPLAGEVGFVSAIHSEFLELTELAADVQTCGRVRCQGICELMPTRSLRSHMEVAVALDATRHPPSAPRRTHTRA